MTENIVNENVNQENVKTEPKANKYFPLTKRDTTFAVMFAIASVLDAAVLSVGM